MGTPEDTAIDARAAKKEPLLELVRRLDREMPIPKQHAVSDLAQRHDFYAHGTTRKV